MIQEDNDLESYWMDLSRPPLAPPPHPATSRGILWMGLSNGDIELSLEWYHRLPVEMKSMEDRIRMTYKFEKPISAPGSVTRIGLWSSKTGGDLLYWHNLDPINLGFTGSFSIDLTLHDFPETQPLSFRRMLKLMGFL